MDINTDLWGLPATWIDGSTTEQRADIKLPATDDTYRKLYVSDKLDLNDMDVSASFWGVGAGCIFNMPYYLSPYQFDGDTKVAIDKAADNISRPLILSNGYFANNQYISYNTRYAPNRANVMSTTNMSYNGKVIMSFSYTKMYLVPYVAVKAAGYVSSATVKTLYEYITDELYTSYPEIISIGFTAYYGDGQTNRLPGALGLITDVDFIGYNLTYNNVFFWDNGGCSTLINSANYNNRSYLGEVLPVTTVINNSVGDSTTALAYKYCKSNSTQVNIYYFDPNNDLWQINKTGVQSGVTKWYEYPYINVTADNADDVRDYILSQIAYLGVPFVYDPDNVLQGQIGDTGVYLPVFDDDGVTTGNYKEGTDALRLPNSEWIDGRGGAGYDPDKKTNDDFGYLFNPHNTNRFATGLTVWSMYQQDILDVLAGINNLYLTDPDGNSKWQLDFKGSNPDDYIVSCKAMLLDVAHSESTYAFKLGPVSFDGIGCYKYTDTGYFSFGSIDINAYYGDFRDYQPYTSMELYIPLCGTVDIDPEFFTGHSMEIIMMYDVYTGACTAGIYRDHYTLYKAVNGQIGADIPVSALQMGTYQSTVHALQAAQKQNEIRLAASAVTVAAGAAALIAAPATAGASLIAGAGLISGAAGLLGGVMQEQNYDYQIEHTQPVPAQTTAAETQNNFCVGGLYPILYIKRAKMLSGYDAEIYSHTIGNACLINGYVGSQTGLVMCSAVDLSGVPATVEEINAIKQALGKGVYV